MKLICESSCCVLCIWLYYYNRTAANHEKCIFSVVINKLLVHHDAQLYIPAPLKCFQTVFSLYKEKLIHQ